MIKILFMLTLLLFSGCKTVTPTNVALLPEDMQYTLPAGQVVHVLKDKQPLDLTFPYPMQVVHSSVLVRNEERLNDMAMKEHRARGNNKRMAGIFGSIATALGGAVALMAKYKGTAKKKKDA